jgi:hypothetical protein
MAQESSGIKCKGGGTCMNNSEPTNEPLNAAERKKSTVPQQDIQLSSELQQRISILNARINNANFANADLLRETDNTFKAMATTILTLQRENVELKVKLKEAPKTQ